MSKKLFLTTSIFLMCLSFVWAQQNNTDKTFGCLCPPSIVKMGDTVAIQAPKVQTPKVQVTESNDTEYNVFTIVEHMPSFPGGELELRKYLAQSIRYPAQALADSIEGKVYVEFVVERDGKITNAKVVRDIGGGCGDEAVRIVLSMPDWYLGKAHIKPVRVKYMLPVNFVLPK